MGRHRCQFVEKEIESRFPSIIRKVQHHSFKTKTDRKNKKGRQIKKGEGVFV